MFSLDVVVTFCLMNRSVREHMGYSVPTGVSVSTRDMVLGLEFCLGSPTLCVTFSRLLVSIIFLLFFLLGDHSPFLQLRFDDLDHDCMTGGHRLGEAHPAVVSLFVKSSNGGITLSVDNCSKFKFKGPINVSTLSFASSKEILQGFCFSGESAS